MSDARELLEIAADYVSAKQANQLAGAVPDFNGREIDLDEIAGRFDQALASYVRERVSD